MEKDSNENQIGAMDEERDNSSLTAEELKIAELEAKIAELEARYAALEKDNASLEIGYSELEAENAVLKFENANFKREITNLGEKITELKANNKALTNLSMNETARVHALVELIMKIPFFGKRIMARFQKMLPPAKETTGKEKETVEAKNDDRTNFVGQYRHTTVIGLKTSENKEVAPVQKGNSERVD